MNNGNHFTVGSTIATAWHHLKGAKWPIWAITLVTLLMSAGVSIVLGLIFISTGVIPFPNASTIVQPTFYSGIAGVIMNIVLIFLVAPLIAGIQMVALKKVRGETVSKGTGFHYWNKWWPLGLTILLFGAGIALINVAFGFLSTLSLHNGVAWLSTTFNIISLIVLILFCIFFLFNVMSVADKGCGPLAALGNSAKIVKPHWFRVFGLLIFIMLVPAVMALPAILGMFCTLTIIKVLGGGYQRYSLRLGHSLHTAFVRCCI